MAQFNVKSVSEIQKNYLKNAFGTVSEGAKVSVEFYIMMRERTIKSLSNKFNNEEIESLKKIFSERRFSAGIATFTFVNQELETYSDFIDSGIIERISLLSDAEVFFLLESVMKKSYFKSKRKN